ncbi:hypothetical protein NDU88_003141 [Pleurodeles waltl]|uniref:Secreted protein n=1 Tax=Pleurodeles waltl TaxID=8319 RepID=A0AAV7W574_PLEWA|nr:hypothetical protein NDU88_003141 [Pleurodeles waltl]
MPWLIRCAGQPSASLLCPAQACSGMFSTQDGPLKAQSLHEAPGPTVGLLPRSAPSASRGHLGSPQWSPPVTRRRRSAPESAFPNTARKQRLGVHLPATIFGCDSGLCKD